MDRLAPAARACADWIRSFVKEVPVDAVVVADPYWSPPGMTAQDVVARVQQKLKEQIIAWRAQTVDTFKAGNPDAQVRGIPCC